MASTNADVFRLLSGRDHYTDHNVAKILCVPRADLRERLEAFHDAGLIAAVFSNEDADGARTWEPATSDLDELVARARDKGIDPEAAVARPRTAEITDDQARQTVREWASNVARVRFEEPIERAVAGSIRVLRFTATVGSLDDWKRLDEALLDHLSFAAAGPSGGVSRRFQIGYHAPS